MCVHSAFLHLLVPPSLAPLSVSVAIDTAWPFFLILSLALTVVWSFLFEPAVNRGIDAEAGGADDYGGQSIPLQGTAGPPYAAYDIGPAYK